MEFISIYGRIKRWRRKRYVPVAESREEAEEFLSDCFATVCENLKEVRAYFKEEGADIAGMSSEELAEQAEVFALPDGRYLIVEA